MYAIKWKQGNSHFLIYVNDAFYYVIPKRFFTSEQEVEEFQKLLETNVETAA